MLDLVMTEVDGAVPAFQGTKAVKYGIWLIGIRMVRGTPVGDAMELGHFDNSNNFIPDAVIFAGEPGEWQNIENGAGGCGSETFKLAPNVNRLLRQLYPQPTHPAIIQNTDPYSAENQGALLWEWWEFYAVGDGTIGWRPRSTPLDE